MAKKITAEKRNRYSGSANPAQDAQREIATTDRHENEEEFKPFNPKQKKLVYELAGIISRGEVTKDACDRKSTADYIGRGLVNLLEQFAEKNPDKNYRFELRIKET